MTQQEFINWLKGFASAIDAERQQVSGFVRSITISVETWQKLKEELEKVEEAPKPGTTGWISTSTGTAGVLNIPPYSNISVTSGKDVPFTYTANLEEDKIL